MSLLWFFFKLIHCRVKFKNFSIFLKLIILKIIIKKKTKKKKNW